MGSDGRLLCAHAATPHEHKLITLPWLARPFIVLVGVLVSLLGAGSVVVPAAARPPRLGSTDQLRLVAPVASASTRSTAPAPSRGASDPGQSAGRAAGHAASARPE